MKGRALMLMVAALLTVAATPHNDDSCEITVAPAATLLLPFFNVDIFAQGETTLFTVTNVSAVPQIAHVTIWTDWSYPVLTFNLYLTGYDVQSINLQDVFAKGLIMSASPGVQSGLPDNPNNTGASCARSNQPATLPRELLEAVQNVLTHGLYNIDGTRTGCLTRRLGGTHIAARGYVTIDVVEDCTDLLPNNPRYYSNQILFDNVLVGDYQQLSGDPAAGNLAQAGPLVHIRAIPEGGPAGYVPPDTTRLPYTFYDHYTPAYNRKIDRRVPLPSTFAARWVRTSAFQTNYKIWREGVAIGAQTSACSGASLNSGMPVPDIVVFDERENSYASIRYFNCGLVCPEHFPRTSVASMVTVQQYLAFFPFSLSEQASGWMYMNLNHPAAPGARPSQNWLIVSHGTQGRYTVDFDAAHLGNGCSTAASLNPRHEIGPSGGPLVCPPGISCVALPNDHPYSGTNAGIRP